MSAYVHWHCGTIRKQQSQSASPSSSDVDLWRERHRPQCRDSAPPIDLKLVLHAGSVAVVGLRSTATALLVTTGPRLVVDLAEVTRCSLPRIPMIPPQLETCREGQKVPSD